MDKPLGLFWLASYPKSGNTWTRIFLDRLSSEDHRPLDLNKLHVGTIASSRNLVEEALGLDISELNNDEIDQLRPIAYNQLAQEVKNSEQPKAWHKLIYKVHDAYTFLPDGQPMFPDEATQGAVLIVRNPLDIAVSYANHSNCTIERSIESICSEDHHLCDNPLSFDGQLRQKLWSWSEHTESWLNAQIPTLVIRYEDLREKSHEIFSNLCGFLKLNYSNEEIDAAIETSEFNNVKQLEVQHGFKEKAPNVDHFFRKGVVGDWQNALSDEQIMRIVTHNSFSMKRLGYLDDGGKPLSEPTPLDHNLIIKPQC